MRRYHLFILTIFLSLNFVQNNFSQERSNHLFIEFLGSGGLYSVNYEKQFSESITGRLGFSYVPSFDIIFASIEDVLVIPLTFSYLIGSGRSKLELGAGMFYAQWSRGDILFFETGEGSRAGGAAIIGYRYQNDESGFILRIGFTPLFSDTGFFPAFGISLGGGF